MPTFEGPVISIHGVPRSGTTWLGEIFNSHPDVAYRYQPLFAYRFRGRLKPDSTRAEIRAFLDELFRLEDDEFILQQKPRREGAQESFPRREAPRVLVMKMVRFHYLVETLLSRDASVKAIGLVRNPCGVINSWLKTPREFKPEWDPHVEWRQAPSKNEDRPEEYFGYEKWKEAALLFLDLQQRYPARFLLLRYEDLVKDTPAVAGRALAFAGLDVPASVSEFIRRSQAREVSHPDSVFRTRDVKDRWQSELDPGIRTEIEADLASTPLARFLDQ